MDTLNVDAFWKRVYKLCERKHLTLGQLESMCSFPKSTIAVSRTRGTAPTAERVARMANALGVSIDYLISGERTDATLLKDYRNSIKRFDEIASRLEVDPLYCRLVTGALDLNKAQLLGFIGLLLEENGTFSKENDG